MSDAEDNFVRYLNLTIHGAKGLMKKDIFGLSDPYVIVYQEDMSSSSLIGRTATQKKTLNPCWEESFDIVATSRSELIVLKLFDENRITRMPHLIRSALLLSVLSGSDAYWDTSTMRSATSAIRLKI